MRCVHRPDGKIIRQMRRVHRPDRKVIRQMRCVHRPDKGPIPNPSLSTALITDTMMKKEGVHIDSPVGDCNYGGGGRDFGAAAVYFYVCA